MSASVRLCQVHDLLMSRGVFSEATMTARVPEAFSSGWRVVNIWWEFNCESNAVLLIYHPWLSMDPNNIFISNLIKSERIGWVPGGHISLLFGSFAALLNFNKSVCQATSSLHNSCANFVGGVRNEHRQRKRQRASLTSSRPCII